MKLRWFAAVVIGHACAACASTQTPAEEPKPQTQPARPPQRPGMGGPRGAAAKELERGIRAADGGDLATAIEAARSAIEKDPNLEKAYLLLGSACAMKEDAACEKEAYDRGTAALPMSAALLNERGLLALRSDDKEAAVADLEKANQLAGEKDPKYMADLAYAYAFVNRVDDGAALAKKARTLDPKSFDAASAHGELLLRKKDGKAAAEAFRAALELTDDAEVKRNLDRQLAFALAIDGQFPAALEVLERLLQTEKEDPILHVMAAESLMNLDRAKDAAAHMASAVKLAPDNKRFLELLLKTQQSAGDKKGAEATKKKLAAMGAKR